MKQFDANARVQRAANARYTAKLRKERKRMNQSVFTFWLTEIVAGLAAMALIGGISWIA